VAIFHSYWDESGKKGDSSVVTFCSLCLPSSKIAAFEADWQNLLHTIGVTHLHMVKASRLSRNYGKLPRHQTPSERMKALEPFAGCVNQYFEIGVMIAIEVAAFHSLSTTARKALGSPNDPYYIAFMRGNLHLVRYLQDDDRFSLVCDDDVETALSCFGFYRAMQKSWPEAQKKMIAISFADDKYFPALQAADMLAFLFRCEAKYQLYRDGYLWRSLFKALVEPKVLGVKWYELIGDAEKLKGLSDALDRANIPKKRP
jgi:hypothetical protein